MSGPKHTPGPWKVLSQDLPDMRVVVTCDMPPRLVTTAAFAGDARLIAAAPRLAEALQRLLNSRHPYAPELHHTEAFRKYVVAESFAREALREAGVEQ